MLSVQQMTNVLDLFREVPEMTQSKQVAIRNIHWLFNNTWSFAYGIQIHGSSKFTHTNERYMQR
jgi:hypothetical protein